MKLNSISPIPEDDAELHLPELVYWASLGDVEQVEQLLAAGTDPNQTDDEGYSALQAAAENDNLAVVKLLVSKGANVAYKGEYTALQLAEMAEHSEVVAYSQTTLLFIQDSKKTRNNSSTESINHCLRLRLTHAHICSIGFKSGLYAGSQRILCPCCSNNS